ncbi:short-chain dehydrogenase [Croceibacterium mercuriale]|uniref:Short-chain dehydrogenase n=1 Tax=Croceibacterium mercuriale TaxID=1572751 RepID=A0A0B2BX73_9SPHN|nr:SDR family oxidoreductase [Croceibacterium mercuriale]KHL26198.1 short-chain dehydrogenase [Croceibacterium mercuriale]
MPATPKLKSVAEQTIVITGATSGHGLATAQMAAEAGARVMLAARDEDALRHAVGGIRQKGGTAEYVVTDVSQVQDVDRLAEETILRFGGFDSWINNAGSGAYGELAELSLEDHRQVFETNYWGLVHGSLAALRHLQNRPQGGALINVGSINGDMASPILGAYNASKHAVKGFTDSLRIEVLKNGHPVSVTLIKPSAIGTPFPQHGRNITGESGRLPPPLYAPEVVARAILDAVSHPRRSVTVGGAGKLQVLAATMLPNLFDRLATTMGPVLTDPSRPVGNKAGNLYAPQGNDGATEGRQHGRRFSIFTIAARHPAALIGVAGGLTAGTIWAVTRGFKRA